MYIYQVLGNEHKRLIDAIEKAYKQISHIATNFYLEVRIDPNEEWNPIEKKESNVEVKLSIYEKCPPPTHNQILLRLVHYQTNILWVIPSSKSVRKIIENDPIYLEFLSHMKNEVTLINLCWQFDKGYLNKVARELRKVSGDALTFLDETLVLHTRPVPREVE